MKLSIPKLSLVVLVGPSGSGKSTFARKHFLPSEVLSSDYCRGLVSYNENDHSATPDAFEVLHFVAAKRLARGRRSEVADLLAADNVAVGNDERTRIAGTPGGGVRVLSQPGCAAGRVRGEAHGLAGGRCRLPGF